MDIKSVDPSTFPEDNFGELTGRALAEKTGTPYVNLNRDAPPQFEPPGATAPLPPQPEPQAVTAAPGGGGGLAPGQTATIKVPGLGTLDMGTPPVATPFLIARMLGNEATNPYAIMYARALMYVRKINGQAIQHPHSPEMAQALMNTIGDRGMDYVVAAYGRYWPAIGVGDLPL